MLINFKTIQDKVKKDTGGVLIKSETFKALYEPLIKHYINDKKNKQIKTYLIGVQGCQGVGKTVLTSLIKTYLKEVGYKVVGFSIDDFYKSNQERNKIRKTHTGNPFYVVSRGLPGTHRFNNLYSVLKSAKEGDSFTVPVFDKSLRAGDGDITNDSTKVGPNQDFVILEGWCVNIPLVTQKEFPLILSNDKYANKLFKELDPKNNHYKTVLEYIKKYQKIWKLLDNKTVMLSRDIKWIEEWRIEQEKRMKAGSKEGMSDEKIKEFVKPYIPFTYLYYDKLKNNQENINCLLTIGKNHLPQKIKFL